MGIPAKILFEWREGNEEFWDTLMSGATACMQNISIYVESRKFSCLFGDPPENHCKAFFGMLPTSAASCGSKKMRRSRFGFGFES